MMTKKAQIILRNFGLRAGEAPARMRGLLLLAELLAATGYAPKFLNRGVEELQGDTSSVVASFLIARHGTKVKETNEVQ